jgi:predicted MPP superfamily phosphohydrolase
MKNLLLVLTLLIAALLSCSNDQKPVFKYQSDDSVKRLISEKNIYPPSKIIVFTDPHYYAESLGVNTKLFYDSLADDKKFLVNGQQVIKAAITEMAQVPADFIIISGDLTKDGEYTSHTEFGKLLKKLEDSGKPVYVVPGNHDISNGIALDYSGESPRKTDTVTPEDFRKTYNEYGYKEAVHKDKNSLSYIAEPVKGLWLFCLDSNKWRENKPDKHVVSGGTFYPETLAWIEDMLIESKKQKKAVMISMHHAVMEHFKGQKKFYKDFVIDNDGDISRLFAAYGVSLVFSGHYHAQDISQKHFPEFNKTLYDIETGSFVTYPLPYRQLTITGEQKAEVKTIHMKTPRFEGMDTTEYSRKRYYDITIKMVNDAMAKYFVSETGQKKLGPQIAEAYILHLYGDEPVQADILDADGIGFFGSIALKLKKDLIFGWRTDLLPADNNVILDLNK